MIKKLKQFRFYDSQDLLQDPPLVRTTNPKSFFSSGTDFSAYLPIIHLGVQTLPGTRIYLNNNYDAPVIVGATGIYELDLTGTTGLISHLQVDPTSMDIIDQTATGYIIIDIIYESQED